MTVALALVSEENKVHGLSSYYVGLFFLLSGGQPLSKGIIEGCSDGIELEIRQMWMLKLRVLFLFSQGSEHTNTGQV